MMSKTTLYLYPFTRNTALSVVLLGRSVSEWRSGLSPISAVFAVFAVPLDVITSVFSISLLVGYSSLGGTRSFDNGRRCGTAR